MIRRKGFFVSAVCLIFMIPACNMVAQNRLRIQGYVVDSGNIPVPMANILLVGRNDTVRTTTKSNGLFILDGVKGVHCKMRISHVGFETKEIVFDKLSVDTDLDSITITETTVDMEEALVTARATRITTDRRLLYPTERQKELSADGITLMGVMKMPRLTVIPGSKDVKYWGKGTLKYYINDAEVTVEQVMAVNPSDVVRVEYIDRPGLEYSVGEDVGLVIRFVTRRTERGMSNSIVADKAVNRNTGNINMESRVNYKRSEFAISYIGDYTDSKHHFSPEFTNETFNLPAGSLYRREETTRMVTKDNSHDIAAAYFHRTPNKDLFYVKAGVRRNNVPGNRNNSILYNSGLRNDTTATSRYNSEKSTVFTSRLHYRRLLDRRKMIMFDAAFYISDTDMEENYEEYNDVVSITDIRRDVDAKSRGASLNGLFWNRFSEKLALQTSLNFSANTAESSYGGSISGYSELQRYITSLKNNLSFVSGAVNADLMLDLALNHTNIKGVYKYTRFEPRFSLSGRYRFDDSNYAGVSLNYTRTRPEAGDLSPVTQVIDDMQIRRGNPDLKRGYSMGCDLDGNFTIGKFEFYPYINCYYSQNEIQEETFLEGNTVVRMPSNFKYVKVLKAGIDISADVAEWLSATIAFGNNWFASKSKSTGIKYDYNKMWIRADVSLMWKKWMLTYNVWTHNNDFYGQVLETSGRAMSFSLSRVWMNNRLSTSLRLQNPFSRNFSKQGVVNYSDVAPYENWNRSDYGFRMLTLNVVYKFNIGRKSSESNIVTDVEPQNNIVSSRKSAEIR